MDFALNTDFLLAAVAKPATGATADVACAKSSFNVATILAVHASQSVS